MLVKWLWCGRWNSCSETSPPPPNSPRWASEDGAPFEGQKEFLPNFQKKSSRKIFKRFSRPNCTVKNTHSNTDTKIPKYRPASAGNLPIPARGGVKNRYNTNIFTCTMFRPKIKLDVFFSKAVDELWEVVGWVTCGSSRLCWIESMTCYLLRQEKLL